jgi:poly-beta-hydroxyalkanoate depolymerase
MFSFIEVGSNEHILLFICVEKTNSISEENDESFRLDMANVINKNYTVKSIGNYRVYDLRKYRSIPPEINSFLKQYGNVEIKY